VFVFDPQEKPYLALGGGKTFLVVGHQEGFWSTSLYRCSLNP